MTPEQLAAIKARLDAATPWPWEQEKDNNGLAVEVTAFDPDEPDEPWGVAVAYRCCGHGKDRCEDDAELIAHAPTDLAALLAYVGQLEGLLRDLCEDSRAAAEAMRLRRGAETALAHLENAGLDAYTQDRITALSSARMALRNAVAPPSLPAAAALAAKKPGGA